MATALTSRAREISEPRGGHGLDTDKFKVRLMHFRQAAGLSRPELSQRSGVSVRTLEGWEQGRREPGAFDLQRVADALGVTVAQLVSDAFPDPPTDPHAGPGRPPKPPPTGRKRKGGEG